MHESVITNSDRQAYIDWKNHPDTEINLLPGMVLAALREESVKRRLSFPVNALPEARKVTSSDRYGDLTVAYYDAEKARSIGVGVEALERVTVRGLTHISTSKVRELRQPHRKGTFGVGFYAGANMPIATTDLENYKRQNHYVHRLELNGSFLFVDASEHMHDISLTSLIPEDSEHTDNPYDDLTQAMLEKKIPYDGLIIMKSPVINNNDGSTRQELQTEAVITNMNTVSIKGIDFVSPPS